MVVRIPFFRAGTRVLSHAPPVLGLIFFFRFRSWRKHSMYLILLVCLLAFLHLSCHSEAFCHCELVPIKTFQALPFSSGKAWFARGILSSGCLSWWKCIPPRGEMLAWLATWSSLRGISFQTSTPVSCMTWFLRSKAFLHFLERRFFLVTNLI